ncbi:MAG: class IV adenylate cyclase [Candidatus Lokiarchaeota archaeon]|nr:class IV adenylate cyclase [Candidatus Lokiarchaeota archaeon]
MIEVEIKVSINDKNIMIEKLKRIGFKFKESVNQKDIYFQHPKRNFVKTDEALRIRETSEGTYLNYKGPKLDKTTKTREEIEIFFANGKKIIKIFEKLGFKQVSTVEKTRDIYLYNDINASIDSVKSLGDYIEFETLINSKNNMKKKRDELFSLLDDLNISRKKLIRKSYLELLLDL